MPLKIGIIDSWLREPHRGSGTAVAVHGLTEALEEQGQPILRYAPKSLKRPLTLSRLLFNLRILPTLLANPPDIVVGIDWDGWLYSRIPGRSPYIVCVKGVLADEATFESGVTRRLLAFQSRLERLNLEAADHVLTTSRYSKQRLVELYHLPASKISIVPEGIDLAGWSQRLRKAPKLPKREFTILCVAKQFPRKRIHLLLEAVHRLKSDHRLKLRIIGDGPEHESIKKKAKQLGLESAIAGAVPGSLAAEYANADLFCLPSVQEGFGIVFLEAMAAGLPIVASRSAAIPEVVKDGRTGLLARPNDCFDLAKKLKALIASPSLRRRFSKNARQEVKLYDWPLIAESFLNAANREVSHGKDHALDRSRTHRRLRIQTPHRSHAR